MPSSSCFALATLKLQLSNMKYILLFPLNTRKWNHPGIAMVSMILQFDAMRSITHALLHFSQVTCNDLETCDIYIHI